MKEKDTTGINGLRERKACRWKNSDRMNVQNIERKMGGKEDQERAE